MIRTDQCRLPKNGRPPSTSGFRPRTSPSPDNRVTLEQDGSVKLSYTPTNEVAGKELYKQLKSMLPHLGMHRDHLFPGRLSQDRHPDRRCRPPGGTVRFGTTPPRSVLDLDCKAHELDNLYVVDTSFFPSIGAVNPALTAMANSCASAITSWSGCSSPVLGRRRGERP